MDSTHTGWWHRHGWTVAILLTAFGFSFAIRSIWAYPVVSQWGPLFTYAGGSDSYYHSRVMTYIILTHTNLIHDPLLRFPIGAINPREPLFDWMNAILGMVFAPFFGGNAVVAGAWFLDLQAPLWSALGVFPVYLIGREIGSRRTGLIAALIFPFLSANIDSSIFGYANYLSFYTFIILVVVYSYIRTVKAVGSRRWVESYRQPRQYLPALRGFLRTERTAVKWAVFTGVSLGALALAWQGYTYAVVVIGISVFISMIAERIRRVDSFGLYVATWIVGLVGFPMAMPYYLVQQQFAVWFDLPLLLFFGVLLLLLPFLLLRDLPWVFSIPFLGVLVLAGAGLLALVNPGYLTSIVTGQGYFVKTLIYSTVAEAQAPSVDQLIIGYGVVTFFLAFVGLAIFVYLLVHGRFKRYHVVFLVFAVLSIYLPISAAKFFLLGSPAFALLPAEAVRRALDLGGYPELRRTVASLSDRRSQFAAFRKAFKVRHVVILALVVGLVLPNVWLSIDAGIPGNTKAQYAQQVANTIPPWLMLNSSAPASNIFGAAGTSLDTPNQYDSAGYNWLAQQDANVPEASRPAFISWWDYGFQAIAQGDHPSVADNFQNGIDPAGQFLLSQNESQAIGVLITTLLQAEQRATGLQDLPTSVNHILSSDGLNVTQLHAILANPNADLPLVIANPSRYLPVNPSTLTADNAMYLAMEYFLATSLPLSGVAKVYDDLQSYTGWSIRYAMSDSRLFPFGASNTGIYYAPADLTGRIINSAGLPTTFFNVTILGTDGMEYPAGKLPAGVGISNEFVNYFAPFYNSMIYHIYIGYNGTQAGLGPGIPGLTLNSPLKPGWMLQHFQVVYKTGYVCPSAEVAATNPGGCLATNAITAPALANKTHGYADTSAELYFNGGESILEYYPGQTFLGDVVLSSGTPVGGARVTVYDGWGIPHMTTVTASDGSFSLVLPPGNDTVNVTIGSLGPLTQEGGTLLKSMKIPVSPAVGLSYNAQKLVQNVVLSPGTVEGFAYLNANNSSAYVPTRDPLLSGATVVLWGPNGTARLTTTTDASGSFDLSNVPPGVYNFNVLYGGQNFTESPQTVTPGATVNATVGLSPGVLTGIVRGPTGALASGVTVALGNSSGIVANGTTNVTGQYRIAAVGPGNYTLTAIASTLGLRSAGVLVSLNKTGATVSTNLTLRQTTTVSLSLEVNGAPAGGVPVRFTPIAAFTNSSVSPLASLVDATGNSTVVTSAPDGTVTAALPTGNYSVYALGFLGSTLYAGLTDLAVSPLIPSFVTSVPLSPAERLSGTVSVASPSTNNTLTAVIAYASGGGEAVAFTPSNVSYSFLLPQGSYTLLALQGTQASTSQVYAALSGVDLTSTSVVPLTTASAVPARFLVGSFVRSGGFFPARAALVSVSAGLGGPGVTALADSNGEVAFYLPSRFPTSTPLYCVGVQSAGFAPTTTCGLSPSGLGALTEFPVRLLNVTVSLTVVGLPPSTPASVTLTAESQTAVNLSLQGGPTFSFTAPPGLYGVGARASLGGTAVYLPNSTYVTTIPLGATFTNLTLYLVPQVTSKGTLTLPGTTPLSNVTVALSSPTQSVTVNGTTFEQGFYAAPGTYSAYAEVSSQGTSYANLSRVTIGASGTISPTLVLTQPSVRVEGNLTSVAGVRLALNFSVAVVGPGNAVAVTETTAGSFSLALPPGQTYALFSNGTALTPGLNGSFYQSYQSVPGSTCTPTTSEPACSLPMVPTTELVWLNGTLSSPGVPGPIPGTVRLVGPYPSTNFTVVPATNGSFSVQVLPGAYSLYAVAGSGMPLAALRTVLAFPATEAPLSITLTPTWVATILTSPPSGASLGLGPATITLQDAFGNRIVYPGVAAGSPVPVALPAGAYTVNAVAAGLSYGVPANATGRTAFALLSGNLGVIVPLAFVPLEKVTATVVGPVGVTVHAGGVATFAFSVRDTGNVPVTIHPVGTPSYWTFDFSFSNATLVPGGAALSGEVVVTVPSGTPVTHPGVNLEFENASGTVLGVATPALLVSVVPYYGLGFGPSSAPPQVGPTRVRVPFYVDNQGNTFESVQLTVVDAPRLAGLGWNANITNSTGYGEEFANLAAGTNSTFYLNLNATGPVFLPPGTGTVSGSVVNATGSVGATTTLKVPLATLSASPPKGGIPVAVTGPSIGTSPPSLPDWLVPLLSFVPALALVIGVVSYRRWRTRRWTRR